MCFHPPCLSRRGNRSWPLPVKLVLLFLVLVWEWSFGQKVFYQVDLTSHHEGTITVTLIPSATLDSVATFCMPAWAPGDYIVSNYGKWIIHFEALDTDSQLLHLTRRSVHEWTISNASRLMLIRYVLRDIPEDSVTSMACTLNDFKNDYVYANGPTVFGYLKGQTRYPAQIHFIIPDQWQLWTALDSLGPANYQAADYDELIDCPFIAGQTDFSHYIFFVNGARYDMVVHSLWKVPMDSLIDYAQKIIAYQTNLFGETPFDRYLFIFRFITRSQYFGALEHRNSSVFFMQPPLRIRDLRRSLYPLIIAHEFFHCWNPKRFSFRQLKKFNYQDTVRLKHMWFLEGLTEYYAKLTMVRTGLWTEQDFLNEMSMLAYQRGLDNLEKLSLRAGQIGVAPVMYSQGALIALIFDIHCREKTENRKSLDDILIYLNKHYARKNKTYTDDEFLNIIREASGVDFKSLHRNYVRAQKMIPVRRYFKKAGLIYEEIRHPYYGWYFDVDKNNRLILLSLSNPSTASEMALQAGDIITHIQDKPVPADLDSIRAILENLNRMGVNEKLSITVERNQQSYRLSGRIQPGQTAEVRIRKNPEAKPQQKAILYGIIKK